MKNTMKIKSLLSFFVPAAMMSLMVASCSDYDNGYNEQAIKFQEEFRKAYGDIDPEQDWNLAERASVTVSTQTESNIKIYAIRGNEFAIVGDYEGVQGTRMLGVDLVEGANLLYVTDGRTAQKCAPGDVVRFGTTRTVYEDPYDSNGDHIKITKLTGPVSDLGDYKTYPQFKYATSQEELDGILDVIPEGKVNLKRVTHDFTFVSNGTFLIYPYYWVTSSRNTIGLYYYDANGQRKEVDIYTAKEANSGQLGELQYEDAYDGSTWIKDITTWPSNYEPSSMADFGWYNTPISPVDWTINGGNDASKFHYNRWSKDEPGMSQYFIEYYQGGGLSNATIERVITGLEPGNYIVEIDARIYKEKYDVDPTGVTFTANNKSYNLHDLTKDVRQDDNSGYRSGSIYLDVVTVNSDGKLNLSFNVNGANVNWLSFKNLKVSKMGTWKTAVDQGKNLVRKSQGIRVDLPVGTKFGMYLKKGDENHPSYQFYSEDELNDVNKTGSGIAYNGSGDDRERSNWTQQPGLQPCHTSTFYVGDQMYIGFEDWPNDENASDFDLNDLVLAFDGYEPTIINEDPEVSSCWLLVCEDLGGSFDTDYNDVIFKVEHVSGQTKAKVTPMAAGGTLASYIVFNDPTQGATTFDYVVGEIHEMFNVARMPSGQYDPINAITSRWEKTGNTVEIPVHENWTIAYNVDDVSYTYDNLRNNGSKGANMGGFYILTLTSGKEVNTFSPTIGDLSSSKSSIIAAPGKGDAPYILCLPYTYTKDENGKRNTYVWAWPQELCTICSAAYDQDGKYNGSNGGAYLDFAAWVSDYDGQAAYTTNKDWYKYKNPSGLTVEDWLLSSQDINDINKNESQLSNNGNLTVTAGIATSEFESHRAQILANLRGRSNGAITIHLDSPDADPWTNGDLLWNVGERTVYVTEAATETTKAGTTSFKITVQPQQNAKTKGIAFTLQIGNQQETDLLKDGTNVTANMGDYFWIYSKNPNNRWEEYYRQGLSAAYHDNVTTTNVGIGTNKNNWNNAIGFKITRWGYQTVTLSAPENDLYTAQTITIKVNVIGKVIMKSRVNGQDWAMALIDGQLKTVEYNENDNRQKWFVEGTVDNSGHLQSYPELLYLRNAQTGQYLGFNKSSHTLVVQSDKPAVSNNFTFVEKDAGDGKFKYEFRDGDSHHENTGHCLGLTSFDYNNGYPTGLTTTENQICKFNMVVVP